MSTSFATVTTSIGPPDAFVRRAARVAAVLFVLATASTMAGQMILEGVQGEPAQSGMVSLAVIFEIANGLASAGVALALYPVLRHVSELVATGYLGLRIVEGTLGVATAAGVIVLLVTDTGWVAAYHDAMFLLVLIVFSCGTLLFYPLLFKYRLVPPVLSLWGLIGGSMLLVSCLLILFGQITMGGTTDLVLSLPIWINEMVLAVWLFLRGLDLGATQDRATHAT
ncbi:MAG: hypothetical protein COB65_08410 [Thalassobium sp.]|nr:MAG: hypothetical protein COB65_08410 [Thalassobium sp.]